MSKHKRNRTFFCSIGGFPALVAILAGYAFSHPPENAGRQEGNVLRVALTSALFESQVNVNDAKAATKVWIEEISTKSPMWSRVETMIFHNPSELKHVIDAHDIDLAVTTGLELVVVENSMKLEPTLTIVKGDHVWDQFMILTNSSSGITSLGHLNGKALMLLGSETIPTGEIWLDTTLLMKGYTAAREFFGEVTEVSKPSQAILPVFFNQRDACLVPAFAYNTLCELNPQLKENVTAIAVSPKYLSIVLSFPEGLDPEERRFVTDEALRYHSSPKGRQVLTTFKMERFVPYELGQTDTLKGLLRDYESVKRDALAHGSDS